MSSTGIAVFAYNRPDHLDRVLSGLKENDVEHLYIFSDGAKETEDDQQVKAVRERIDQIDWCQTTVRAHDRNLGLAESLTNGIRRVFENHSRIVVLEDDCVPAPNFISFMNDVLNRYADNKRVMNVSGYSPPIEIPEDYAYDVYFTYRSSSWGWGTWRSAWEHFEQDPFTLDQLKNKKKQLKSVTQKAGNDLYPMMRNQLQGDLDSWAVWWSYAIGKNSGLCATPVESKIRNIGHDGTGTHTGKSKKYDVDVDPTPVSKLQFPQEPYIEKTINQRYIQFISEGNSSRIKRFSANLLKKLRVWNLYKRVCG